MPSPPRRSTRSALPPTTKPARGDSSSSSLSSVRPERSTRSVNKSTTPQLSASPLSSEDGEGAAAAGHLQTRRSKQSQHGESVVKAQDDDEAEEEPAEGADITRCICGQQEYPGPPLSEDNKSRLDANSEDAGGLFIQCDKCSVWQHGGCVGIMDEDKTPENYFCELCEKKLHRVFTDSRGQRFSRYLPLFPEEFKPARKESFGRESEGKGKRDRDLLSRSSAEASATKRRSTMNSRQAYDEEETLRRVIEESRGENETGSVTRKGKRTRDESEDTKQETKRQRTSPDSLGTRSMQQTNSIDADSDDDGAGSKSTASSLKKARSVAAESQRQREMRERETARQAERAKAASSRQHRAGKRRNDESEAPEEAPKVEPKATPVPASSQPPTPPAIELQPPSSGHKRGGNRKPKRLGRNQYTKDKDLPSKALNSPRLTKSTTHNNTSSGEEQTGPNGESNSTSNSKNSPSSVQEAATTGKGKGNRYKGRHGKGAATDSDGAKEKEKGDLTIKDMDKGTQFMLDFIAKHKGERIVEGTSMLHRSMDQPTSAPAGAPSNGANRPFDQLSSQEMADELMKQISTWRGEYSNNTLAVS